ncbi:MAG: YbjN domain-containing protein [Phycisphaerae bacterium]|nr:YbjN domain-containing protein [Phycisphaerae bacterium]
MSLIATIQRLLERKEIEYLPHGSDALKLVSLNPDDVYGYVQVHEEDRTIIINTAAPLRAPHDKRLQLAELLARANWHIPFGNLQINWNSGLITFETSVILGNSDCHPDLFYALLIQNWWEMDRWFPAIEAVIFDNVFPEDATNMILRQRKPAAEHGRNSDGTFGRRIYDVQHGSMN